MTVELIYAPQLAQYRFNAAHPLRPERFTLAVDLMRAWDLLDESAPPAAGHALVVAPAPITDEDLLRVHDSGYIYAVKQAGFLGPEFWRDSFGLGEGDTPPFRGMHEAATLIAGATVRGLDDVLSGACVRAFSPAGGMHHAQRNRAAGFCVYNDAAIAIAKATEQGTARRVAYVDVDTHHGDGVQAAFYGRNDVLTVSAHESGRYLFPGTGRTEEIGEGDGEGFAVNLPLPPGADDECFAWAFERVIAPAVRAFVPDVIVAQLGADTHVCDPLAHLATTVAGQYSIAQRFVALADEVCDGRILATGGGGYDSFSAVPRAWACAMAALLGVEPPAELPEEWRERALKAAAEHGIEKPIPTATFDEPPCEEWPPVGGDPQGETERVIEKLLATHPLFAETI